MKMNTRTLLAGLACALPFLGLFGQVGPATTATTVFVAKNATGSGVSWADATGDLKAALANASAGTQIWVKEGTYTPTVCSNCTFSDRNQYFQVKSGVRLYGGFAGFETEVAQRNLTAHTTVLSGDINNDGSLTGNSFTVVFTQNVSNETLVDGFTITGGNADQSGAGLGTPQTSGGGWFNLGSTAGGSSHPVIANCKFVDNYAWGYGGGMFNDGSFAGACSPTLLNCEFTGNEGRDGGGGMYNTAAFSGFCSPVLTSCVFTNNASELSDGGGIFNSGSEGGTANSLITNCLFVSNTAFTDGGALYNFGKNGNASPVVKDCVFEQNVAEFGGGVYNDGTFAGYSGGIFENCSFVSNHSTNDGGAIYNSGYQGTCSPVFTGCLFETNYSVFAGGAVFNNGNEGVSSPTFSNCRFKSNEALTYGGAMYNFGKGNLVSQQEGNSSPSITNCLFSSNFGLSAGAIYNLGAELGNANAMITNCTFHGNHANIGGALYCNAGEQGTGTASPTVTNCIFWENTAAQGKVFRIIWGTPTISHSLTDVADCDALYNGNGGNVTCGNGLVFNQDPAFVSVLGGNFHVGPASPVIDKGSNPAISQTGVLVDLDSLPRISNNTVDMGVYEYGATAGNAPVVTQSPENQSVCEGDAVVLAVSANGSQPLAYQWFRNGNPIGGATQNTYTIQSAALSDAGTYACAVTNNEGTSALSSDAELTVHSPAPVAVSIAASQTEICQGEQVTLSAMPVNGGPAPIYQWFINGNAFGGSVQSFNTSQAQDGDVFYCQLVSSEACVVNPTAVSNSVAINVENLLVAALSLASDADTVCEGHPLHFTAIPVNGGNSPSFAWTLNGSPVGANAPTLLLNSPQNGDQVHCTMTSSKNCVVANPVHSNTVTANVVTNAIASVSIAASVDTAFCLGTAVSFTASQVNGGSSPGFEWLVNGLSVGGSDPVFVTDSLHDGDVVVCYLSSSLECLSENPVLSNVIVVSVDSCESSVGGLQALADAFVVFPNPSSGKILVEYSGVTTIFAMDLLNTQGQILFSTTENHPVVPYVREFDLTDLPKGVYYLRLFANPHRLVKKLVIN